MAARMPISVLLFALGALFSGQASATSPQATDRPIAGTTRFILDGNRIYARIAFVRPDGSLHRGLAYVDTGAPTAEISQSLLDELRADQAHPVQMRVGTFPLSIETRLVEPVSSPPRKLDGLAVEATLPATVLSRYEVVVDYGRKQLTLAGPGTLRPSGIPTPFRINEQTGLAAVNASINGHIYPVTIDLGSAWTWFRQSEVTSWLAANRGCDRGTGAVGPSNMMMVGDLEASGVLARLPTMKVGPLLLKNVDLLGPGPTKAFPVELFDWYSRKNAVPVLGWIGGNVLKQFRLTFDYPNRTLYWQREAAPDSGELNQIGLTLRRDGRNFVIAGIATKDGRQTVDGVRTNDILVAVDGQPLSNASLGKVFDALHGVPGERHLLLVRRDKEMLTIPAQVTAF